MKTFRMIGMALFAVFMCVNFAACSSDDDGPTEEMSNEAKALIGTWFWNNSSTYISTYTYTFKSNGEYDYCHIEGNDEPDEWSGKYTYNENLHKLTLYKEKSNLVDEEFFIDYVDSKTLKILLWEHYEKGRYENLETYTKK